MLLKIIDKNKTVLNLINYMYLKIIRGVYPYASYIFDLLTIKLFKCIRDISIYFCLQGIHDIDKKVLLVNKLHLT